MLTTKVPIGKEFTVQSFCVLADIRYRETLPTPPPKNIKKTFLITALYFLVNVSLKIFRVNIA